MDFSGTWIDGDTAAILFAPPDAAEDLIAHIRVTEARLGPQGDAVRVCASFEGETLARWRLWTPRGVTVCKLLLPARLMANRSVCRIQLRVENPPEAPRVAEIPGLNSDGNACSERRFKVQAVSFTTTAPWRYSLGETLDFTRGGSGVPHTDECWDEPDGLGMWSIGPESAIVLWPRQTSAIPVAATFTINDAAIDPERAELEVEVGVNDEPVARWTHWPTRDTHPRTVALPARYFGTLDPVRISLSVKPTRSSFDLGWSTWDKRPRGIRLKQLTIAPVLQYHPGDVMDFTAGGGAIAFAGDSLGIEWAVPDAWGCWTIGRRASITVPFDRAPAQAAPMTVVISDCMVSAAKPKLPVIVKANGETVAEWELDSRKPHTRTFQLPAAVLIHTDLTLAFEVPDPRSPADFGWGPDPSLLGLRLALAAVGRTQIDIPDFESALAPEHPEAPPGAAPLRHRRGAQSAAKVRPMTARPHHARPPSKPSPNRSRDRKVRESVRPLTRASCEPLPRVRALPSGRGSSAARCPVVTLKQTHGSRRGQQFLFHLCRRCLLPLLGSTPDASAPPRHRAARQLLSSARATDSFYLALLPACSTIDFLVGLGLMRSRGAAARRLLVSVSVAVNLALLVGSRHMGAIAGPRGFDWIFPLGLSFYTFQSLTYTLDLYRRDAEGTGSLLAYLSAVSFFPTLQAGPITRVSELVKQFAARRPLHRLEGGRALFLIGLGLLKKAVIADLPRRKPGQPRLRHAQALQRRRSAASPSTPTRFSSTTISPATPTSPAAPRSCSAFACRSTSTAPISASNVTEFWRRWHISFSNWLRDYLYFSLPGMRTKVMPYVNLVITMVLGGLWHGLTWTFAIWGLLHGGCTRRHALASGAARAQAAGAANSVAPRAGRLRHLPVRLPHVDLLPRRQRGHGARHSGPHRLAQRGLRERHRALRRRPAVAAPPRFSCPKRGTRQRLRALRRLPLLRACGERSRLVALTLAFRGLDAAMRPSSIPGSDHARFPPAYRARHPDRRSRPGHLAPVRRRAVAHPGGVHAGIDAASVRSPVTSIPYAPSCLRSRLRRTNCRPEIGARRSPARRFLRRAGRLLPRPAAHRNASEPGAITRIVHYGDSPTTADLITGDIRVATAGPLRRRRPRLRPSRQTLGLVSAHARQPQGQWLEHAPGQPLRGRAMACSDSAASASSAAPAPKARSRSRRRRTPALRSGFCASPAAAV